MPFLKQPSGLASLWRYWWIVWGVFEMSLELLWRTAADPSRVWISEAMSRGCFPAGSSAPRSHPRWGWELAEQKWENSWAEIKTLKSKARTPQSKTNQAIHSLPTISRQVFSLPQESREGREMSPLQKPLFPPSSPSFMYWAWHQCSRMSLARLSWLCPLPPSFLRAL